ncbi:hypothetical protein ABZ079_16035 [Streptomyces sp. NPDC006314]|uniref:hypothetical protein n=1 Tax=Streptomyces sp. NPDC006314 TaxID=3154475 RepID=UPI0033A322D6
MAAEVPGTFEYRIMHTLTKEVTDKLSRTIAVTNAATSRLERFEERRNETRETCEHCGAQLRVALPSFAEVRRERRLHGVLWKVCALATVLGGYGFVHVIRTATGKGYGPGMAFVVTGAVTLFFAYRTLISGLLTRSNGAPEVTRVDRRERGNIRHGWAFAGMTEDA